MRKEIVGIFLFFLVIFTLISLLSYSPNDPSIHNAKVGKQIHNLFGILGAHLSGALIGLFGLGAFWFPLLLLLASPSNSTNKCPLLFFPRPRTGVCFDKVKKL